MSFTTTLVHSQNVIGGRHTECVLVMNRLCVFFGVSKDDVVVSPYTSGILYHRMAFEDEDLQFAENGMIEVCFTANVHLDVVCIFDSRTIHFSKQLCF